MTFRLCVIRTALAFAFFAVAMPVFAANPSVGQPLPPWQRGMLDIHQINNGTGNAAFLVLPDGTTFVVDAGAGYREDKVKSHYDAPQRPNASLRPGQWVAQYIKRFHPQGAQGVIDYALLTHFHGDHMGTLTSNSPKAKSGAYRLTGITDLGDEIQIRTMLDRGWPTYQYPSAAGGEMVGNYRAFLKWQADNRGLKIERFQPGRADQIVLRHAPKEYPNFKIQNLASNGYAWTGTGTEVRNRFPEGIAPDENNLSNSFRLNYGAFTYFNGGDMAGVPDAAVAGVTPAKPKTWDEMETAVAWVCGPVDVAAVNHHGTPDVANAPFLSILRPRVHIMSIYASSQPGPDVLRRLLSESVYPGPRDVFMTNAMWPDRRKHMVELYGEAETQWLVDTITKLGHNQGHVVVRVAPGGATYQVIMLDDSKPDGGVLSVNSYESRVLPPQVVP